MRPAAKITRIEVTNFEYEMENLSKDYNTFNMVYEEGATLKSGGGILSIYTDQGSCGRVSRRGR